MTDAAFWDRIAPKYAEQPISNVNAYEDTLARVQTYLGPDTTALELGCGTGSTALRLQPGTRRYVAADISTGMIEIAKSKIADATTAPPEFRVGGVEPQVFEGISPNTVLAFNLLHLLPDLDAALATIHENLSDGGLFISKTPCVGAKWYYWPLIKGMQLIGKVPLVTFLSVEEVDARIAAAGFRIVETGLFPPSTPSRFVVARKV